MHLFDIIVEHFPASIIELILSVPDWDVSPKPKPNSIAKTMKTINTTIPTMSPMRLCLAVATALAAVTVSSHAQSATATISGVAAGSSFDYTITLVNTGTDALNSFWYGWTPGVFDLPSTPSGASNSL